MAPVSGSTVKYPAGSPELIVYEMSLEAPG